MATHANEEGGNRPGSPPVHSDEFHPCTPSPIHTQMHVLVKAKVCLCVLSCSLRMEAVSNSHGIVSEALPLLLINKLGDCMGAEYPEAAPAVPLVPLRLTPTPRPSGFRKGNSHMLTFMPCIKSGCFHFCMGGQACKHQCLWHPQACSHFMCPERGPHV